MATCKKCGANIIWIKTKKGKSMPCDSVLITYQANKAGKDTIVTPNGETIRCRLTFNGEATGMGYISHWSTCPNADEFRKR